MVLVSAIPSPDGKSIQIHLRETGNRKTTLQLTLGSSGKTIPITEVDVTGREVVNGSNSIGALESKFFRIDL